jgi:hypothetical protein
MMIMLYGLNAKDECVYKTECVSTKEAKTRSKVMLRDMNHIQIVVAMDVTTIVSQTLGHVVVSHRPRFLFLTKRKK